LNNLTSPAERYDNPTLPAPQFEYDESRRDEGSNQQPQSRRQRRNSPYRHSWVVATLLSTLLLAACSPSASNLKTPNIIWPDGAPSGPLEDSDWGQAYRHIEIELSTAQAFGDFSDPDLIAAVGYDLAERYANNWSAFGFDPETTDRNQIEAITTYASKSIIADIEEQTDGRSAEVSVCGGWFTTIDGADHLIYEWEFARSDDGHITVTDVWLNTDRETCSVLVPQPGLWAEPFDSADIDPPSVKKPLPRDYYIDLGVISE